MVIHPNNIIPHSPTDAPNMHHLLILTQVQTLFLNKQKRILHILINILIFFGMAFFLSHFTINSHRGATANDTVSIYNYATYKYVP